LHRAQRKLVFHAAAIQRSGNDHVQTLIGSDLLGLGFVQRRNGRNTQIAHASAIVGADERRPFESQLEGGFQGAREHGIAGVVIEVGDDHGHRGDGRSRLVPIKFVDAVNRAAQH